MSILQFQFKWPKLIFRNNKQLGFLIVSKFNGPFSTLFHILCLLIFFFIQNNSLRGTFTISDRDVNILGSHQ